MIGKNFSRVQVYRLPRNLTNGYCFSGGVQIEFLNVDWFDAPIEDDNEVLIKFIKKKRYYNPTMQFLVLGDHPKHVFVITKEASHD